MTKLRQLEILTKVGLVKQFAKPQRLSEMRAKRFSKKPGDAIANAGLVMVNPATSNAPTVTARENCRIKMTKLLARMRAKIWKVTKYKLIYPVADYLLAEIIRRVGIGF